MGLAWWLNTAWMWKCRREARRFATATRNVRRVQEELLIDLVRRNQATWFGSKYDFQHVQTARDYQCLVPLSTHDDYAELLHRIAAGEANVLTGERVELLEPTSGTTRGEKLIPYTAALRREFQRAVAAWIADLYEHRPAVRRGRAYWSISPALGHRATTAGGVRIGFDDDTAYLGGLERWALRHLLAAPPELARIADIESFRYLTLWSLLCASDLTLISVWNPTFLSAFVAGIEPWTDRLIDDVRRGTPRQAEALRALRRCPRDRAAALVRILKQSSSLAEKLR